MKVKEMSKIFYHKNIGNRGGLGFTRYLKLLDEEKGEIEIEIGMTTDDSGAPVINIGQIEVFEDKNGYEILFRDLLEIIVKQYTRYNYNNISSAYKEMASVLRHYANIMDIEAEEELQNPNNKESDE